MTTTFDVAAARARFPALQQAHQVFFDNAGGTQALSTVASSVKDYLEETNVQLGASYDVSKQSTEIQRKGLEATAEFIGADPDEVVIGPSTTQLFANLSQILPPFPPGSEIILSRLDHEANLSSWVRLAKHNPNITIKWWPSTPPSSDAEPDLTLTPTNLHPLLTPTTRLVACTHASNILGTINPIRALSTLIHSTCPTALFCVDGVALTPHRHVDVHALGVDFYAFSWYKVYGPHIAVLYAKRDVQRHQPHWGASSSSSTSATGRVEGSAVEEGLGSLGHYFHGTATLQDRLGLAGSSYELVAAVPRVVAYLGGHSTSARVAKWEDVAQHEESLQEVLLAYLREKQEKGHVTIWGLPGKDRGERVPVISFTVRGKSSKAVVEAVEGRSRFGCRWGHFYSKRMVDDLLGLGGVDGVVRVSLVHYNTVEEVGRFVEVLDEVLREGEEGEKGNEKI